MDPAGESMRESIGEFGDTAGPPHNAMVLKPLHYAGDGDMGDHFAEYIVAIGGSSFLKK